MTSSNTAVQLDALSRFYDLAPHKPYCTNELGSGLRITSKKKAFNRRYIQHNPPSLCHWLTFDQDHNNLIQWEEAGLPEPNLIVRNLENQRAHVHYAIESVCTSEAAKPKPLAYAEAVQEAYREQLKADRCYTGLITKNPYNENWHTWELHQHVYSLGEMADYVELKRRYWTRKRAANTDHYGLSRNNALFHRLRYWSYDYVMDFREQGASYESWMKAVLDRAESFNDFAQALPYSEIKSTAKSVGNFTWFKYWPTGKPVKRGAMSADFATSQLPLNLTTKQRLSARRSNEIRRSATASRIEEAVSRIEAAGLQATYKTVAKESGISINTVESRLAKQPRKEYLKMADDKRQQAIGLHEQGMSQRKIAKELGVSRGAVENYLKQNTKQAKETKAFIDKNHSKIMKVMDECKQRQQKEKELNQ